MARPATGQVLEYAGKRGKTFAIRFTLPSGERRQVRLGREADGWTARRADDELQAVLADLRRGRPNERTDEQKPDPVFAEFAFEWFDRVRRELRATTVADYEWQLLKHLLPWFGKLPLSAITAQEVDRYRHAKVREGELNATSINKTIARLAQVLDVAVEYKLIDRNPAKGRNRRLKAAKYHGTALEDAEQIAALLDAAGELDRERRTPPYRRALLSLLVFTGLRIDEALSLRWRHVSLPARRLKVAGSKTDAGVRTVELLPALADELAAMRARSGGAPDALVFGTSTGAKQSPSNVRNRVLAPAVELANAVLQDRDVPPLPEPLTPHSLRRTFASLLLMLGEPVPHVMDQLGHTDPKVTLSIYARVMRRSEGEKDRLRALVDGGMVSARFGANGAETSIEEGEASAR